MKRMTSLCIACATIAGTILTSGCATPAINASPMKTGVKRFAYLAEVKPDMVEQCKKIHSNPGPEVAAAIKAAHIRNHSIYLKKIEDKYGLFTYMEYDGSNVQADMSRLEATPAVLSMRKACLECLTPIPGVSTARHPWSMTEEVFFTDGATEITPVPAQYKRIGMITGLKPEKEAEYRTLHATTWPGVLKGIKDGNMRNFSIDLAEFAGKLYLIGYLEYVGTDSKADDAKGKDLAVNKRWWKYTDACQQPLPEAAAKGEIWSGMDELYHQD